MVKIVTIQKEWFLKICEAKMTKMGFDHVKNILFFSFIIWSVNNFLSIWKSSFSCFLGKFNFL